MSPTQYSDVIVFEYNNVHIAAASFNNINIEFPAFADGVHIGPSQADIGIGVGIDDAVGVGVADDVAAGLGVGEGAGVGIGATVTSNVLPFGPVNLAFPDIRQTAFDTYAYQRTYFYSDGSA